MAGRSRAKSTIRSVLKWPVLGPAVTKTVGALSRASAHATPQLDGLYRRLPISGGLAYGSTADDQRRALLDYYERLDYRLSLEDFNPTISILVPTYRPNHRYLWEMLMSVGLQTYPHWQLCIVDDASGDPEVTRLISDFARQHPDNVAFKSRQDNGHISVASNDALAMATGEYVALLDHDDRLYPQALAEVVLGLRAKRDTDGKYPSILYTDERIIDEEGFPDGEVWRKPDWMPLLHLTSNYTNHLTVYRRALVEEIGGFRLGFEGSQDHDLMLRATEEAQNVGGQIAHVPALTYQWRSHSGSVAKNPGVKSYSVEAAMRAVNEACERRGTPARVWREPGSVPNRVDFRLPDPLPSVSLLLRPHGGSRQVCLTSLTNSAYPALKVVDETALGIPDGVLFEEALRTCDSDFLAVISDDLVATRQDWLEAMLRIAILDPVGVVGGLVLDPDDRVISAGLLGGGPAGVIPAMAGAPFSERSYLAWAASIHEVLAVSADAMLIDVAAARRAGGFDIGLLAAQYSDVDLCLRLRREGQACVYTPYARFRSQHSRPYPGQETPTERDELLRRWAKELTRDPYVNPGLEPSAHFNLDPTIWLPEVPPELFAHWLAQQRVD